MTSGTFFRSTVLPTCSTTNASSGMRQSARPRARAFGASEKNARSTPNGTTLMRRSSPSQVASSRFSHSVRSEERRVGKECRSRWSPDNEKKKKGVENDGSASEHGSGEE